MHTLIKIGVAAALCLAGGTANAQVTIYQVNDVYRIDAVDNGLVGGLGRAATLIEQSRRRGENVLILHGGDFIAPSLESRYWGGKQMIDAMNFLHAKAPLIAVPGNHEFDERSPTMLAEAIAASRFPWLASNLRLTTGTPADQRIQQDTVIRIGNLRVGIFGLTIIDDARTYATVDTAYLRIAQERIAALEAEGADVILALTHLPIELDREVAKLRRTHPKLMWVVSGHEHYVFDEPMTDSTALLTNGESNARNVFRVKLTAGKPPRLTSEMIRLDSTIAIDRAYQAQIEQKYRTEIERIVPFFNQRIGTSSTLLDGREEAVRGGESTWGNYLTDVMRGAFPDIPADIAVLNGGAIRIDDIVTGPIRWEHLARTFGFPTRVALVWLRGSDVIARVLEQSVSGEPGNGRFLQVSGVRFSFDRRLPAGSRVSDVHVQRAGTWQPIDLNALYIVAVPDYSYGGGDGYTFRSRAVITIPPGPDLKLMVFDALSASYAKGVAIAPVVEGRIREVK
jgi:2',3'-cyclic-nucleotide 2'-phosphodiesterase (5'-nucleotidase family)